MTALTSVVRSSNDCWIPKIAAIIDFRRVFKFIETQPLLYKVAQTVGMHNFIRDTAWDGFYGRVSESEGFYYVYEEMLNDADICDPEELSEALKDLEGYVLMNVFTRLSKEICRDFQENGYTINRWISETAAIVESTDGRFPQPNDPSAHKRISFRNYVGYDPRRSSRY